MAAFLEQSPPINSFYVVADPISMLRPTEFDWIGSPRKFAEVSTRREKINK
jgi:hypothetical protein